MAHITIPIIFVIAKVRLKVTDSVYYKNRLFGTDGIRGVPGEYPLTDGMIFKIGKSIAHIIIHKSKEDRKQLKVIIGRDTRLSGRRLEVIIANAINGYGIDVLSAGIITTPGLSFLVKETSSDMGIMISASHNKPTDNGIKLFNSQGQKLSQEEEEWIENVIFSSFINVSPAPYQKRKGTFTNYRNPYGSYIKFLLSTVEGINLKGMRIAIDCAWGASAPFVKKLFRKIGAKVYVINDSPSGEYINGAGAMNTKYLREVILDKKCDIGIALDGDGDRGILLDEKGLTLNGDHIMAIIAYDFIKKGRLAKNTLVATVMSNMALRYFLENNGGHLITTKVGDKYVLETLLQNSLNLGGEQSGHIIFLDYLSTPDGLLTGLQILKIIQESQIPLSELSRCITMFPQVLVNVRVRERKPFEEMPFVYLQWKGFQRILADEGRIILRYSGTEPLARIMVEGKDKSLITEIAHTLANAIRKEIGVEEVEDNCVLENSMD